MMPHKAGETPTLGAHCFQSVAQLPYEFYAAGPTGGYCNPAVITSISYN